MIDLPELGSSAARRRFMVAFSDALYETNEEPLHLEGRPHLGGDLHIGVTSAEDDDGRRRPGRSGDQSSGRERRRETDRLAEVERVR